MNRARTTIITTSCSGRDPRRRARPPRRVTERLVHAQREPAASPNRRSRTSSRRARPVVASRPPPPHFVCLNSVGATHLSTHPHRSKYCPVQCASPVVSFATRSTHASYAATNLAHFGLHASSSSGLMSTGSSSSDLRRDGASERRPRGGGRSRASSFIRGSEESVERRVGAEGGGGIVERAIARADRPRRGGTARSIVGRAGGCRRAVEASRGRGRDPRDSSTRDDRIIREEEIALADREKKTHRDARGDARADAAARTTSRASESGKVASGWGRTLRAAVRSPVRYRVASSPSAGARADRTPTRGTTRRRARVIVAARERST